MKKSNKKFGRYPFIIHADPLKESTAYPTHTHGLYDIGKPEFLMDPIAFGGKGNGQRINSAYKFFKKQKNTTNMFMNNQNTSRCRTFALRRTANIGSIAMRPMPAGRSEVN